MEEVQILTRGEIIVQTEEMVSIGGIYYQNSIPVGVFIGNKDEDGFARVRIGGIFQQEMSKEWQDAYKKVEQQKKAFRKILEELNKLEAPQCTVLVFCDWLEENGWPGPLVESLRQVGEVL